MNQFILYWLNLPINSQRLQLLKRFQILKFESLNYMFKFSENSLATTWTRFSKSSSSIFILTARDLEPIVKTLLKNNNTILRFV